MQRYVKPCASPIASIYPLIYNINYDRYALPPPPSEYPPLLWCAVGDIRLGGEGC